MKNLHKKISAIALAGLVIAGGLASSVVNASAIAAKDISEKSLIAKPIDPNKFIGESKEFEKAYFEIIDSGDIPDKDIQEYEKIVEKIKKFRGYGLCYVALPGKMEEKLKEKKYSFKHLNGRYNSLS